MNIHKLLRVILRCIGLYTMWRGITSFIVFIGLIGTMMGFSSPFVQMGGAIYIVIATNAVTTLLLILFSLYALFSTDKLLEFLGVNESTFERTTLPFDQIVFTSVLLIGAFFIASGSANATELNYNVTSSQSAGINDAVTRSGEYNFSLFSLATLVVGIIFLTKAKKITNFFVSRYNKEEGNTPT